MGKRRRGRMKDLDGEARGACVAMVNGEKVKMGTTEREGAVDVC